MHCLLILQEVIPISKTRNQLTRNFRQQLPMALSKVKPSTCRKLIAKVVAQEEKYWAEDAQLYEYDFDEISEKEWAAD